MGNRSEAVLTLAKNVQIAIASNSSDKSSRIKENVAFIREFFNNKSQVGGMVPSSRALGNAMATMISRSQAPLHIIEVGVGTGQITEGLIRALRPQDSLVLVEMNPRFCQLLREKMCVWRQEENCPQLSLFEGDVRAFTHEKRFNHIVCSIPFNNFDVDVIRSFFATFRDFLGDDGRFSYYEYVFIRWVNRLFYLGSERKRLNAIEAFFRDEIRPNVKRKQRIFKNFPPAIAYQLNLR